MIPHEAREAMMEYVSDSGNDPMNILGAAIALLKMHGDSEEQRIAAAVDKAVKTEIIAMHHIGRVNGHC